MLDFVTYPLLSLSLQAFICELYVYLLDEMHVGLNNVLSVEDRRPIPASPTTTAQLKHFAHEAEVNGNFQLAATFYREVSCLELHFTTKLSAWDYILLQFVGR